MKKILFIVFVSIHCSHLFAQNTDVKIEFTSTKEALKNPEKVYRLDLSNQKIELSNEDWSKFVNLESLKLKNDHLKEIPLGLTKITTLKTLDLSGNDFAKLPENFTNLVNLEEVFLNNEKNIDLPNTLQLLATLPKLKSLHLENDNLSSIPKEMFLFKNLEYLYLNENNFIEVPRLEPLNHLKFLDLKSNKIKPELQEIKNTNFGFKINF
jgi:Leucine-rich repeat (LRR) protein